MLPLVKDDRIDVSKCDRCREANKHVIVLASEHALIESADPIIRASPHKRCIVHDESIFQYMAGKRPRREIGPVAGSKVHLFPVLLAKPDIPSEHYVRSGPLDRVHQKRYDLRSQKVVIVTYPDIRALRLS